MDTVKSVGYVLIGVVTLASLLIQNIIVKTILIIRDVFYLLYKLIVLIIKIAFRIIGLPLVLLVSIYRWLHKLKNNTKAKKISNKIPKIVKKKEKVRYTYSISFKSGILYNKFSNLKSNIVKNFGVFVVFIKAIRNYFVKKINNTKINLSGFYTVSRDNLRTYSALRSAKRTNKVKAVSKPLAIKKDKTIKLVKESKAKPKSKIGLFILGIIFGLIFIMVPYEIYLWFRELPKAELLIVEGSKKPTRILDKNGQLLYEIYVDRKYDRVELNKIPTYVINATLAVEDSEFYNHYGIRPDRIIKAAKKTIIDGEKQGASTITQQLIKNVLLTPERTISRKLKEVILTFFVEAKYTKDQILELYLNNISYGGVAWGIQSASQKYFGKNVWELSLAEAAMLAGLPSAPSAFSPLVDITLAKQRQLHVLNRMSELGYITKTELVKAYDEELVFIEQRDFIRAPHFVQYVRNELENMYGKREVEYGGLTVTTTLDLNLQESMEKIVKEEIDKSANLNLTNGAAVVIDVEHGGVLGYVGSVDYFKDGWGAYDVASAYRQPGSSIKPVTYALALEKGFTAASIIQDEKISYPQVGGKPYNPVNYDGKYHGNVTFRSALANSYNIPAVKLAHSVGPDNIVTLGKAMGLKNWEADGNYGLSITLGGKEVKLLEHTNVYATFAREGIEKDISSLVSVKDSKGYELYKDVRSDTRVLKTETSYLIWDILSDNNARIPAFGPNSFLVIPNYKVAVKTGTTDNKRDNWTMGFTPSYSIGVWVGNNDNAPMSPYLASGLTGAAPIWNRITVEVLKNRPNEILPMPDTVFKKYDKNCNRSELFVKGSNVPENLCPPKEKDDKKDEKDND